MATCFLKPSMPALSARNTSAMPPAARRSRTRYRCCWWPSMRWQARMAQSPPRALSRGRGARAHSASSTPAARAARSGGQYRGRTRVTSVTLMLRRSSRSSSSGAAPAATPWARGPARVELHGLLRHDGEGRERGPGERSRALSRMGGDGRPAARRGAGGTARIGRQARRLGGLREARGILHGRRLPHLDAIDGQGAQEDEAPALAAREEGRRPEAQLADEPALRPEVEAGHELRAHAALHAGRGHAAGRVRPAADALGVEQVGARRRVDGIEDGGHGRGAPVHRYHARRHVEKPCLRVEDGPRGTPAPSPSVHGGQEDGDEERVRGAVLDQARQPSVPGALAEDQLEDARAPARCCPSPRTPLAGGEHHDGSHRRERVRPRAGSSSAPAR